VEAVVVLLHAAVIWLICELIVSIFRAFNIDLAHLKVYFAGICAVAFTIIYMIVAYILGSNVYITNYEIDTNKNVEPLRIVQIADSHLGVSMTKDTFPAEVEKIKAQNPDMVLITGDYVDDDSYLDQLEACTKALSTINCKYGVYYSFGNHDKGLTGNNRGYDTEKLVEILKSNNVKVLEDEIVNLDNEYLLIGRADASKRDRQPISQLVSTIDPNTFNSEYSIVMDHQPNDYDNEAAANVDLVLSGHTHGGQFLPINNIGVIIGANDYTYGHKKIDNTDFIVTSGISSWAIRFKTGTKSEIVVIDVK
jgi:predicted MPP superfamily phosphohydrolase